MPITRMLTALFVLFSASTARSQSSDPGLSVLRQINIPFMNPAGRIPNWSGGAWVTVDDTNRVAPVLYAFDGNGVRLARIALQIPGADRVLVAAYKRSAGGGYALAGSASSRQGAAATWLALISPQGEQRLIRLSPFYPFEVAIAPDGSVWVAGEDGSDPHGAPNEVLRRFSPRGAELGRYLPRATLETGAAVEYPAEGSHLAVTRDRVAWYSNSARIYKEFSPAGVPLLSVPGLPLREPARVDGLALCEGGQVFVSVYPVSALEKRSQIWRLDRQRGLWTLAMEARSYCPVYGCDGDLLVTRLAVPGGLPSLAWLGAGPR